MADERYQDFDAYWAEKGKEPLRVKVFGEEYDLPPELPATLAMRFTRLQAAVVAGDKKVQDEVDPDEVFEIATELFGKDALDAWLDQGIGIVQLSDVLEWSLTKYGTGLRISEDGDGDEGEDGAPEGASPESSRSGRSSRPTSLASTRSTSRTRRPA